MTQPRDEPKRMTRVAPGRFDEYEQCAVYLDDLEKIANLISSVSGKVTVTADDYMFESVTDLRLLNRPSAEKVKIEGKDPYIYFEIRPYLSRMYLSDTDDVRIEGVAAAVRAVVERRKLRPRPLAMKRFSALLRTSADPAPHGPPGFFERNPGIVAAAIGGLVGAAATAAFTLLLIWLGVLKAGAGP